jgi:hypothetical protein
METEGSLPCAQGPSSGPYPEPDPFWLFVANLFFCSEEFWAPRPTTKLEAHPLSAVATAYSVYSQLPYLEAISSICNLKTRHAVVTRDPLKYVTVWLYNQLSKPLPN